jgi:surface protein
MGTVWVISAAHYTLNFHPPKDKDELKTVVDLWVQNSDKATNNYRDISSWNVSNVTNMSSMFNGVTSFNADISGWNVSNVKFYTNFAEGSGLTKDTTPNAFKDPIILFNSEKGTNSSCKSDGCIFDDQYCKELYGQCGILKNNFIATCNKWDKCAGGVCSSTYKLNEKQYCLARGQIDEKSKSSDMWGFKKVVKGGIF